MWIAIVCHSQMTAMVMSIPSRSLLQIITPPKYYSLPAVWADSSYTSPKWGTSAHRSQQCSPEQGTRCLCWALPRGMESYQLKKIRVATVTMTVGLTALKLCHKAVLTGIDCRHFLEWLWKWRISLLADRTISKCPTWEGGASVNNICLEICFQSSSSEADVLSLCTIDLHTCDLHTIDLGIHVIFQSIFFKLMLSIFLLSQKQRKKHVSQL